MQVISRKPLWFVLIISIILIFPFPVYAHNSACSHFHVPDTDQSPSSCDDSGKCDDDAGLCIQIQFIRPDGGFDDYCVCRIQFSFLALIFNYFEPLVAGLPIADTIRIYEATANELNAFQISFGDNIITDFTQGATALTGTITLSFGSFADPENIPVQLLDVSLQEPSVAVSGFATGPTLVRLPFDQEPPALTYNSKTGTMNSTSGGGITLATDNQLDFDLSTNAFVSIAFDGTGNLTLFAEMSSDAPSIPQPLNPERISVGQPGRFSVGDSSQPSVSHDGRFIAFAGTASNLVTHDQNSATDIFVLDSVTGSLERISINSAGIEANNHNFQPSISSNGTIVSFISRADNLVPSDFNGSFDVFVHNRQTHQTTRVSLNSLAEEANGVSTSAVLSGNGRYVAFASVADNLVENDHNGVRDIFVHDLQTGVTTRVSVDSSTVEANGSSDLPAISDDGRFVAFSSNAENLVEMDNNSSPDIFVHDRNTGATTRVSVSTGGVEHNGFFASDPVFSADGRYIAFSCDADNLDLSTTDNNELDDIFVHDQQKHTTTHISVTSGDVSGNGDHLGPVISANGRFVAYTSDADNLVMGDLSGWRDVFVYDRDTSQTTRVSVASNSVQGNDDSGIFTGGLAISADGNQIFFESLANNLVLGDANGAQDIFMHNRQNSSTSLVIISPLPVDGDDQSSAPAASFDGSMVAFSSLATNLVTGDINSVRDVFVRDRGTATTTRVSVHTDGTEGNDTSDSPAVSDNGRYVAYESFATNLIDSDNNEQPDVFFHDRETHITERISVSSLGAQANDMSFNPSMSADGQTIAFVSYASNLIDADNNDIRDVFVHHRKTQQTSRVSIHTDGTEGNDDSGELRFVTDSRYISANGRYVAYESDATTLVDNDTNMFSDIFVRDLMGNTTERISISTSGQQSDEESESASISADGRYVAFASLAGNLVGDDGNIYWDIFIRDRVDNLTTRVSLNSDGNAGNGDSKSPSISADGRIVTFTSSADNLVLNDNNGVADIFSHDRQTGMTTRISIDQHGVEANLGSLVSTVTPDGQWIAYKTRASNLIADDTNDAIDIYIYNRSSTQYPGDFDHDGDIDHDDGALFYPCVTGPDVSPTMECIAGDFDFDHDVDLVDVSFYLASFTDSAPGGGTISGSVITDVHNEFGISVGLADQADVMVSLILRDMTLATTRTDANGQYSFTSVVEGRYDISATAPDGRSATVPVEVATEKTTTINFGIMPQQSQGIFASYAGIAVELATMSDPDLNNNGIIDLGDLRSLRLSIDPKDTPALELAEQYFGRIVMITDLHYQPDPTTMGATFMIGDGLAMGQTISGSMTALVTSTGDPTSAVFTITEDQGVIDLDKIGLLDFQADPKQSSSIIIDLDNGRILKGIAYLQLSGGILTSPQNILFTLTQGFFALAPGGFEFYLFAGATGTLAFDFPVFAGLAVLLSEGGEDKKDVSCSNVTLLPGDNPALCDFGGKACATENTPCALGGSCRKCVTKTKNISGGHVQCVVCHCVP